VLNRVVRVSSNASNGADRRNFSMIRVNPNPMAPRILIMNAGQGLLLSRPSSSSPPDLERIRYKSGGVSFFFSKKRIDKKHPMSIG